MQENVSFETTPEEAALITDIAFHALRLALRHTDQKISVKEKTTRLKNIRMDITAAHANGCPLDLEKLRYADTFTLLHDVFGICEHLDRDTGKLSPRFLPRCAKPQENEQ